MKRNATTRSIFDNRHETASQESLLRSCNFALQRDHEPSTGVAPAPPSLGAGQSDDRNALQDVSEALEKMEVDSDQRANSVSGEQNAAAVCLEEALEDPTVYVVSQKQNTAAVDLEEEVADQTGHDVPEKHKTVAVASGGSQGACAESESDEEAGSIVLKKPKDPLNPLSSSGNPKDRSLNSPAKENTRAKLKIPLREVVKAIVVNSKNPRDTEEDHEIENMSFVEILMRKGIKFPRM